MAKVTHRRKRSRSRKKKIFTKKDVNWQCFVCSLNFTGPIPLASHLATRAHTQTISHPNNRRLWQLTASKLQKQLQDRTQSQRESFQCEECGITTTGYEPLLEHMKGSQHAKNTSCNGNQEEKVVKEREKIEKILKQVEMRKKGNFWCQLCSRSFDDKSSFKFHMESKGHQKAMNELSSVEYVMKLIRNVEEPVLDS